MLLKCTPSTLALELAQEIEVVLSFVEKETLNFWSHTRVFTKFVESVHWQENCAMDFKSEGLAL